MSQFPKVNQVYGAPLGRSSSAPAGKVRVFRVKIDSGGYDDGGAYWGIGQPLYCALGTDGGRAFTRADSRLSAIVELGIDARDIKQAPRGKITQLQALANSGNISARGQVLLSELRILGY